jgi:LuxR family maltose regulon positive regulatory protein
VVVADPLLETKFHVPKRRRGQVARPRLVARVARGARSTVTLVSAPAGFGKTTLLAEWLAGDRGDGCSAAWVSLGWRDNDPAVFWPYVVAALRTAGPDVGTDALALLRSVQPPPIEAVLATLLNDLGAVAHDIVLVLDDYHLIEAAEVQDGMVFLLEHLPPQVHLVLATRADPPLPLAGLRGRGELVEIRAADLRFTADEAAEYLNDVMGLALTAQDVAALEGRTEGWITAIQLAALSMQGRDDVAGFIAGFAGDDRYIVDYLAEEVLQRQPEQLRSFLLQTSILSRLSGSLCEAVTDQRGGKAMLEALDRGNLFLVPLDDRRQWYRYHHLFADVLQARLLDEQPDALPVLHRRASDWYERDGDRSEAVGHALAGKDFERAAELVELAVPALHQGRQDATLRRWLESLPDEAIRVRPVLSTAYVGALLNEGKLEGVEARLRDVERWLERAVPASSAVVADEVALRRLPGEVAMYRAGYAQIRGDVGGVLTHARRALELADKDDHLGRGAAAALLGLAYWTGAHLTAAHRWYAEGMASLAQAGHVADVIAGAVTLADLQIVQGHLGEALSLYEQGLRRATEHGGPVLRGAADMHVGISQIRYERNDLDDATHQLQLSRDLGVQAGFPQNEYRWRVGLARIRRTQGDLSGALDLLDEAERLYAGDFSPNVRPVPALRTRMWLALGDRDRAVAWAHRQGLSTADDLTYLREFEHITLARVLLARYAAERAMECLDDAMRFLERLRRAAEAGNRTGSLLEILVLQSLGHQAGGDLSTALVPLEQAMTLAEPEGYVRLYVDEGPPMVSLLRAAARQGIRRSYAGRLLAADEEHHGKGQAGRSSLIEPLSERELEVLRLLGSDLGGPDIARRLVVSLNTVRTHTNHVYAKLGVNNRRAAVRRARELGLLSRTGER